MYRVENNEIVISGFEKGISDDPYNGLFDMRGVNTISVPGEASVSFSQTNIAPLPVTFTITSISSNKITPNVTSGTLTNFVAGQFTNSGGALPTGISGGTTYWLKNEGGGEWSVWVDPYWITQQPISGGSGTNTFTSINMGQIRYFDRIFGYCVDVNGRAWSPLSPATIQAQGIGYTFMNNTITNGFGNGICVYKGTGSTKYLFIFRSGQVDYTPIADTLGIFSSTGTTESPIAPAWVSGWNPATGGTTGGQTLNTAIGTNNPHEALVDVNNVMFFTDASYVGSLREKPGSTFDPTTPSTYEWNITALALPKNDISQCLEQLGDKLLIGGLYNYIYSWNKFSTGFDFMQITEKGAIRIITVNTNAYIFAGKRGRIFKTNGSQAELYKKVPDHILGIDPIFTFYGVAYNKNQLYFGVSATTNAGATSTSYMGVWAIDTDTNAMRIPALMSTNSATCVSVFTLPSSTTGFSIYTAWATDTTYGIDKSDSTPYTSYTGYIDTDVIPIGQFLNKKTFNNFEFKLSAPLVSGEGIKISWRSNLSDGYTLLGETTTTGVLSDSYTPNFQSVQWIQFRIEQKSTNSNPSFTRLTEMRLRVNL
ncbi:hypothetical protein E6Q11_03170 [Candidatus Dojkabacteria bacterium]|uniref:Uncharacterized protein n=1 Tax=Candidatus Dojkabacteria bacterium TaxID=2099670 RepID=A0A5C7J6Z7_9BACT|nr:MAG: hypothetical protein E6Q11_03170 [Candidatus Dojkabacteria bacterium]